MGLLRQSNCFLVNIKWGKEILNDIELDVSQPPATFFDNLYSLTRVAPARQKLMMKGGGLIKLDSDWSKLAIKNVCRVRYSS